MATFCITFMIAVSTKTSEQDVENKEKHKSQHEELHNESKKEEKVKEVYDIGHQLAMCHIEYNITVDHKYEIDVISWDKAAKIYTSFGEVCIKVFQNNNISWVVFSVYHRMNLQDKQLEELHKTQINFKWSFNKSKLGKKATNDKLKPFYISFDSTDDEYYPFLELYQSLPKSLQDTKGSHKFFDHDAASSLLSALPYRQHRASIMKIIECVTNEILKDEDNLEKKSRGSTDKKGLKGKNVLLEKTQSKQKGKQLDKVKRRVKHETDENGVNAAIKGEDVFTGSESNAAVEASDKDFPILKVSVVLSVLNLMTNNQRMKYNPFIVAINKLCNLPVTYLKDHGITSASLSYTFLDESISSSWIQIDNTMYYNDSHVLFTHKYPITKLLEVFQTGSLKIDILGTCDIRNENNKNDLTQGKDGIGNATAYCPNASFHNRNLRNTGKKSAKFQVYLARCRCPLYPLYFGDSIFELTCPLYIPNSTTSCLELSELDGGIISTNEINSSTIKHPINEPLITNGMLQALGSSLDIVLKIVIPMKYSLRLLKRSKEIYNRIFCVMTNFEIGIDIVETVISWNKLYLHTEIISKLYVVNREARNFQHKSFIYTEVSDLHPWGNSLVKLNEEGDKPIQKERNCLTGFIVYSLDEMLIYIEGMRGGRLEDIWNRVNKLSRKDGKVFYNSELCFESRLYKDFIKYGGLYMITLKESLNDLLSRSQILITGFVPEQCRRSLVKLDLLRKSRSMKSASLDNLFPLSEELVSLDTEFGLPPSRKSFY